MEKTVALMERVKEEQEKRIWELEAEMGKMMREITEKDEEYKGLRFKE